LEHLSKVRPVLDAVDDVLKYLILSPRSVVGAEEPVPEGSFFLGHWTCIGSVDCSRLRTVRGKESIATNKPGLPPGVSPRSYPAG
jgi:hypothetical protein